MDENELERLKSRAEYFGLDKTKNFEDFKQKYLNITEDSGIINTGVISIADCKDAAELSTYLSKHYGIECDTSVESLDYGTVQGVLAGCESMIRDFPELGTLLQRVTTKNSGVMACTGGEISFNPNYFSDSKVLTQLCQDMSACGHWVNNSTAASIGVHESAHAVEKLLIDANPSYDYNFERTLAWNDCSEAKLVVSEAVKRVKKTDFGKGKKRDDLRSAISKYALEDESETMAEAFADVYANGDNATPLSTEIVKVTKERLEKYKNKKGESQ